MDPRSLDEIADELARLATAATPGPWERAGNMIRYRLPSGSREVLGENIMLDRNDGLLRVETTGRARSWDADAAYLAALSPDVVLRLLARRAPVDRDTALLTFLRVIRDAKSRRSDCPTPGNCMYPQHHSGDESAGQFADRLQRMAAAALAADSQEPSDG